MNGWDKIGETWQKRFAIDEARELTVIIGQEEGSIEGLAFKETAPDGSPKKDPPGTRLEELIASISPEALIEIIAKRDKYLADLSETKS